MAPNTPGGARRLPAPPSARALATLRDDPLEPAAIHHHPAPCEPTPERSADRGVWEGLIASGLALVLGAVVLGPAVFFLAVVAAAVVALRESRAPPVDLDRPHALEAPHRLLPAASACRRPVRALGPEHATDQLAIDLKLQVVRTRLGFRPHKPGHRDVADLIHTCRARDGLGFTGPPSVSEPGALVASIEPFAASVETLHQRLGQWARVADFIEAQENPRAVWLAAVACREETSARRAAAALRRLAATPRQRPQLDRVLRYIDAEGHWCARGAAAIHRGDAKALTRLIAEAPSRQIPSLICLIEARWQADPDPALFDIWAAELEPGLALVQADLPGAGAARWQVLSSHGAPEVAGQAVRVMLRKRPPLPLLGARTLLGRADIQRLCADGAPPQTLIDGAIAAMEHLAHAGDVDDLRLLGPWTRDPCVGAQARQSHQELKTWLGAEALGDAGGLALAAEHDASGGLSSADDGGLSPAALEAG